MRTTTSPTAIGHYPSAVFRRRAGIALLGVSVAIAATLIPAPARAQTPITAQWVIDENAKPGTKDWQIPSEVTSLSSCKCEAA